MGLPQGSLLLFSLLTKGEGIILKPEHGGSVEVELEDGHVRQDHLLVLLKAGRHLRAR